MALRRFRSLRDRVRMLVRPLQRYEIDPDEVLLDASNLPAFDTSQLEGRIETPIGKRSFFLLGGIFFLAALALLLAAADLQIRNGNAYAEQAQENRLSHEIIFADRGAIYDRAGRKLAWSEYDPAAPYGVRAYAPFSGLAHVIGYAKAPAIDLSGFYYQDSYVGRDGVERLLDEELAGVNGKKIVEKNARGEIVSQSAILPPKNGDEVFLSIDAALNERLHNEIAALARRAGFRGGAGVLMDIHTGELVALTSYPEFQSAVMTDGDDKGTIGGYLADPDKPLLNRAVQGLYTPGSIVKPFVAAAALEEGVIDPLKKILSTGSISVPNPFFPDKPSIFKDWKAHGWVDMRDAIAVSSDVYFYEVGGGFEGQPGLGIDRIYEYMTRFGFGVETGFALPGEGVGVIPTPAWKEEHFEGDPWRIGDTYNTAIGQYGFQVTALQAVRATAAIASGGILRTPTILRRAEGQVVPGKNLGLTRGYIDIVQEGMRRGVIQGTAQGLNIGGLTVAGKTGTAELGASKRFVNSWVIGFFPFDEPRFAFAVIMERGPAANLVGASSVMGEFLRQLVGTAPEYTN